MCNCTKSARRNKARREKRERADRDRLVNEEHVLRKYLTVLGAGIANQRALDLKLREIALPHLRAEFLERLAPYLPFVPTPLS